MTASVVRPTTLQEQARVLRDDFPELFEHLSRRDELLQRAFRRIPSPADVELSATWNHRRFVDRTLEKIGPGLSELGASQSPCR